ncbi:MAG: BatA domain-containing protein [Candidatus Eisenbacteria bacterium]
MPPFLNGAFLFGLLAAALPIVIHLFSRRPAQQVQFPSVEYLREITLKRVRRVRLRQWLLLALRVAILALFALAMARPAIQGASKVTRGSSTIAILLDNSWSLNAADPSQSGDLPVDAAPRRAGAGPGDEEGTCLALAKRRAHDVLDLMGDEDKAILALVGRPVTVPLPTPLANPTAIRQEVDKASLAAGRADFASALDQILPVLRSAHTLNKELFVISDFQQQDLEEWASQARGSSPVAQLVAALAAEARADSAAPRSVELPDGMKVYLVPVRDRRMANLTLARVRFEPGAGSSGAGTVVATVVNHGEDPVADRLLRALAVDAADANRELGDASVSVPPLGQAEVTINLSHLPADGAIELRLGSDLLEYDNHAYLVAGQSGSKKVLLISGASGAAGGLVADEDLFLKAALDPTGKGDLFSVRVAGPEILTDPTGFEADVVIIANVGRLSEQAVENLGRFRAAGGGILITMGSRVDPRYYNTEILGKLSTISLLNILQDEGQGTFRSFRPTVLGHPIFSGFGLGPGQDLSSSRFRKIVECRLGSGARVLADWSGSLPALVEENGLMVFTSSLDGEWNDFVTSASFLPWLHQSVGYLAARGNGDLGPQLVGGALELSLPLDQFTGQVTCLDQFGGRSDVAVTPADRTARLKSQPTTIPGVYRFVDSSGKRLASFAVNLDPKEGDLAVASKDLEGKLFGRGAQVLAAGQRITRELLEGRYGRELWRPLLIAVLLLLVVESLLARGKILT